jgi:SNF2 family DNA or RNA helicase
LEEIRDGGHSVIIFSAFASMLRLIQETVAAAGLGSCHIDGQTRDRAAQVDAFQNDPDKRVFLISLKAGGYGLNLTKADTVIHFDPWWNPAVEAQATDRAHRIGQERPVTVYKLITTGTVEEKILKLQEKKRNLMDAALDDEAPLMEGLTDEDLRGLLGW